MVDMIKVADKDNPKFLLENLQKIMRTRTDLEKVMGITKEIITGNQLIAEFMHFEIVLWEQKHFLDEYDSYYYHCSWDWLIPCIRKINEECIDSKELDKLEHSLISGNILEAWTFVVKYLKSSKKDGGSKDKV